MKLHINEDDFIFDKDLHEFISKSLAFPKYYGNNLDALYDVLSTDVERPVEVIWTKSTSNQRRTKLNRDGFIKVFKDIASEDDEFKFTIQ